jgi:phage shock protein PspC (stress-responsive transcriptional regulator)
MLPMTDPALPTPTFRPRQGRWLGGVCAGLAARWELTPGRVRLGFAAGALLFGLGVLVYLAAWLILPGESEEGASAGQRGIVLLAQTAGALLGLATLAGLGAVATVFGWGWIVVALGAAVLIGVLASWRRLGPAWALLPVGSLVLPSVAMAVGGVAIDPSTTARTVAPGKVESFTTYESGLGTLTVDLRDTVLPERGVVPLRIKAGVRRTLIALPHDRCVHVSVRVRPLPRAVRLASYLLGEGDRAQQTPLLFGAYGVVRDVDPAPGVDFTPLKPGKGRGPTLQVDIDSLGGDIVVRDFPNDLNPATNPNWPGFDVFLEGRPDLTGLSGAESRRELRAYRERRAAQRRDRDRVAALKHGPCTRRVER